MDALTISAASGLRARMETLDMLANNLANASTTGFKSDREFYSLYVSAEAQASAAIGDGSQPTTVPVIEKQFTDFTQGMVTPTGNPLDLALSGNGFFTANGPNGPLYTRNGTFRLSATGALVTAEGYPLRAQDGKTIQSQTGSPFEVTADGEVRQDGQSLGKLDIADFTEKAAIVKQGNNYFRVEDSAVKPVAATAVQVQQGKIESSNVSSAHGAVRLVSVMRQFEMLQKAISMSVEMNKHAIEEVARVGS
jgi:flagellar basal-body rod protein FlgF